MKTATVSDELAEQMEWMGFREQDILRPDEPLSDPTTYFFGETQLRVLRSPSFKSMMQRLHISSLGERELYTQFRKLVPNVGDYAKVLSLHIVRLPSEGRNIENILVTY